MYPPEFDYARAASIREAIDLMQEHQGAKLLAGGHSLLPLLKLRQASADMLIDIGRISQLKGVARNNGTLSIGALTTHAYLASTGGLPGAIIDAASHIGDWQVRNRGTIGGNVAHADPASDHPTVLTALDAEIHITGDRGERNLRAGDFFLDLFTTALSENEIITDIDVPTPVRGTGSAYFKMVHPASAYSVLGAAAMITIVDGVCSSARVAVGGLTPKATRAFSVEAALTGKRLDEQTIEQASRALAADLPDDILIGDFYASTEYRKAIAPEYVQRAVTKAADRARM
jgi:carbon-monoxide dehydrogenase medium subunit